MKTNYNKIKPIDKLNKVISTLDMLFDEFEKKKPKKIKVNCSFCNSKDSVKAFSYKNCNYRKCKDCDSIFLSPRITKKWLDEYYKFMQKKFIFEIPDKQRQVRIERLMKPRWKLLFKRLRPFIKKLPINRYMEIGPGVGYFTEVAKANRFAKEYVLVEPDIHCQSQLKKLGKNIKVLSSILEKVNLKDSGKADIIFINSVIEHPFSIEVFFQKLSQLTKSKGIVVLVDMHCNGLDIRTLKEKAPNINVYTYV